jgi:hypothetical protein
LEDGAPEAVEESVNDDEYVPEGHGLHEVEPAEDEDDPAGQLSQESESAVDK